MLKVIIFILLTLTTKSYAFNFEFRLEKCLDLRLEEEFNDLKASSSFFSTSKNNDELLEILEEATVYTYCN